MYQSTASHNSIPSRSWFYNNIGPTANGGLYFPWLGKRNRNLVSSYTTNLNGRTETLNFTYLMNAGGYVENYVDSGPGSPYTIHFLCSCH